MKNGDQAGVGKKKPASGPSGKKSKRRREERAERQQRIEGRRPE